MLKIFLLVSESLVRPIYGVYHHLRVLLWLHYRDIGISLCYHGGPPSGLVQDHISIEWIAIHNYKSRRRNQCPE